MRRHRQCHSPSMLTSWKVARPSGDAELKVISRMPGVRAIAETLRLAGHE
ncbi:MAG: hypothetical protein QG671_506 [Actinomycetota bacterium]|nr:hypothetical protein [Actinomycetota bacterium]